jgi:putative restriction endonuclease
MLAAPEYELSDLDDTDLRRRVEDLLRLPPEEWTRQFEQIVVNRAVRDISFRRDVRRAYDYRCAITGLSIRNGGCRPLCYPSEINADMVREFCEVLKLRGGRGT